MTSKDDNSISFLPSLVENFPRQYLSLEELTLSAIPKDDHIESIYKFIGSCQRLKRLRIGIPSLRVLSDVSWEKLSYVQLRVEYISMQDVEQFATFFRRYTSLKRIVICLEWPQSNVGEDDQVEEYDEREDDDQSQEDELQEDEEGDVQLLRKIRATVQGIKHHVCIVDP